MVEEVKGGTRLGNEPEAVSVADISIWARLLQNYGECSRNIIYVVVRPSADRLTDSVPVTIVCKTTGEYPTRDRGQAVRRVIAINNRLAGGGLRFRGLVSVGVVGKRRCA